MQSYLLRDFSQPMYLTDVTSDGLKATFRKGVDNGLQFTAEQRAAFRDQHRHIKGRWVLLKAEQARVAASVASAAMA